MSKKIIDFSHHAIIQWTYNYFLGQPAHDVWAPLSLNSVQVLCVRDYTALKLRNRTEECSLSECMHEHYSTTADISLGTLVIADNKI